MMSYQIDKSFIQNETCSVYRCKNDDSKLIVAMPVGLRQPLEFMMAMAAQNESSTLLQGTPIIEQYEIAELTCGNDDDNYWFYIMII